MCKRGEKSEGMIGMGPEMLVKGTKLMEGEFCIGEGAADGQTTLTVSRWW